MKTAPLTYPFHQFSVTDCDFSSVFMLIHIICAVPDFKPVRNFSKLQNIEHAVDGEDDTSIRAVSVQEGTTKH